MTADPRLALFRHPSNLFDDWRRLFNDDNLPMPRCFLHGPKWRRHFEIVTQRRAFCRGRLIFTFEPDVRELVRKGFNEPEELRPGVFAEWSEGLHGGKGAIKSRRN